MSAASPARPKGHDARRRILVRGLVQGVGFRPHTCRLARRFGLAGWVCNTGDGVLIEVEGSRELIDAFLRTLSESPPAHARIGAVEVEGLSPTGEREFRIRTSRCDGGGGAAILPDLAACPDCLLEVFDPRDRRYLYPFTNCTHCGPRFSIIEGIPYDRARTTMRSFRMCPACLAEYRDPASRRYHAQPNACPVCGPRVTVRDTSGVPVAEGRESVPHIVAALRSGAIVAMKGVGGYHLLCDARDPAVVGRLRRRKTRPDKPFALMVASLDEARRLGDPSNREMELLSSPAAPIVLVPRRAGAPDPHAIAPEVARGSPELGIMLAHAPLHHIVLRETGFPVVATSGNRSGEPVAIDDRDALERLAGVADLFVTHDRPILRPVEDSVARVTMGRESILRPGRGHAPLALETGRAGSRVILGTGAHLKATVSLASGGTIVSSAHLGDLDTLQARRAFERAARDIPTLAERVPDVIACDLHPDYPSTRFAVESGLRVVGVQHHVAHVAACMADNDLTGPVLGVAWDGTGYGDDGTIWGGEFLLVHDMGEVHRFAHLRQFRLPGGERAVREPRRTALGLLHELFRTAFPDEAPDLAPVGAFDGEALAVLRAILDAGTHSPRTSSAGRLFDGIAALIGLRQVSTFEGHAALELEWCAGASDGEGYPFRLSGDEPDAGNSIVVDWGPTVAAVIDDVRSGTPAGSIAAAFHDTMARMILAVAERAGIRQVALTGGCFQNRRLLESTIRLLRATGFEPFWHHRVPCNDGGISVGQVVWAASRPGEG
ncbi:MAG: carbamoyltransferase HypF [Betaproteobacteria bacterium]|nr:carbamoyltransferase HypF [Betaproteobacteria bacterium]